MKTISYQNKLKISLHQILNQKIIPPLPNGNVKNAVDFKIQGRPFIRTASVILCRSIEFNYFRKRNEYYKPELLCLTSFPFKSPKKIKPKVVTKPILKK